MYVSCSWSVASYLGSNDRNLHYSHLCEVFVFVSGVCIVRLQSLRERGRKINMEAVILWHIADVAIGFMAGLIVICLVLKM